MLAQIPEKYMHLVRWVLTGGWLMLIFSLFYDPISPWLTEPNHLLSPFRINPETCIKVQGICLEQHSYPLGASLFWSAIVPSGIFILLVFGHEFWRRICPLSFLSQIPRALGKQRHYRKVDPKTGQVRYELAKIKKDSWLARNYLYLQFGLLYVGVCCRILFFDSHRLILGIFLLITIASAILVGFLYGGKSWCHYFCPMGPVQTFYGEPRGLLTSVAHEGDNQTITQSMCRRINAQGKEESACVACNSPCIDIDAERSYWDGLSKPNYKFLYYSYAGLVIGFFVYYYLYSGDWNYLLSGAWSHQDNQLGTLFSPGFYLFNRPIPIPKLVAAPLTVGLSSVVSYFVGRKLEKLYKTDQWRKNRALTQQQIQHQFFTLCTFFVFNFFFIFAGRSYIGKLPLQLQYVYNILLVVVSTLWLYRTWSRSSEVYSRESLASRLRKQLSKLQLDVSRFLEGRSLESLNPDEVYVLAKILPGFTGEKRIQAYKGVLRDALEEGYVNSSSSLEVLQQMRQELGISDQEHLKAVTELGVEDPDLLNPNQQRSRENQIRLQSFRNRIRGMVTSKRRRSAKGLGRELLKVVKKEKSVQEVLHKEGNVMRSLSREYGITWEEEEQILAGLDQEANLLRRSNILLNQLQELAQRYQSLEVQNHSQFKLQKHLRASLSLLQATIKQKQRVITKGVLEILENLGMGTEATRIALALASLAPHVLPDLLNEKTSRWEQRLNTKIISRLQQQVQPEMNLPDSSDEAIVSDLEALLNEPDSLTKAVSLYLLCQFNSQRGQEQAQQLLNSRLTVNPLVKETAQMLLRQENQSLSLSTLEKLLYLSSSDLFNGLKADHLIDLAYQAQVKIYRESEVVFERGYLCQELLLLIQGEVQRQANFNGDETRIENLSPVQMLNELEILAHTQPTATLVAMPDTYLLTIDVNTFDDLLSRNTEFARRILEQKTRRLQQVVQQTFLLNKEASNWLVETARDEKSMGVE